MEIFAYVDKNITYMLSGIQKFIKSAMFYKEYFLYLTFSMIISLHSIFFPFHMFLPTYNITILLKILFPWVVWWDFPEAEVTTTSHEVENILALS